jgi:hypothetical protein
VRTRLALGTPSYQDQRVAAALLGDGRLGPNAAMFRRGMFPRTHGLPLPVLVQATDLTKGACSRIGGKSLTHLRHWAVLADAGD